MRIVLRLIVVIIFINAGCRTFAQPLIPEPKDLVWRTYESHVAGRKITFEFPANADSDTRFKFYSNPTPSKFTKDIQIIWVQFKFFVNYFTASYKFMMGVDLIPVKSQDIADADTAIDLLKAIDTLEPRNEGQAEAPPGAIVVSIVKERKVVHIGKIDWVWERRNHVGSDVFDQTLGKWIDDGKGAPQSDRYITVWDHKYLLEVNLYFGDDKRNAETVAEDRAILERVLNSLTVLNE